MNPLFRRRAAAALVALVLIAAPAALVAGAAPGTQGPPPTPVPPDGRLSPFPQRLETPRNPVPPPDVSALGAILADLDTGTVLYERAAGTPRPIASLTKVMTALIVLERTSPDDVVTVDPRAVFSSGDYGASSTLGLRAGERRTVDELLHGLLLGSANDAAEALAIHVAGSVDTFVRTMNRRAGRLGMADTEFRSPHGLDDRGVSTPRDLVMLATAAHMTPGFTEITRDRVATIGTPHGPDRRIQNRNALLWLYPGAFGTKTGYTTSAGPSVIASAERGGRSLVAVVLRADDEPFSDAASLLDHGFAAFEERTLVQAGSPLGSLRIEGGSVPVAAGETLAALVPADGRVTTDIHTDPGAAFPPEPGEQIGTLAVQVDGRNAGSVPVVVAAVPSPEPLEGSWWSRGLRAIGDAVVGAIDGLATS